MVLGERGDVATLQVELTYSHVKPILTASYGDAAVRNHPPPKPLVECEKATEPRMSIIAWIVLGLISGFIASKLVNKTGEGFILDLLLGIVGAIVGGFLFTRLGAVGVTGFNLYSMFVAVIGAVVVLVLYHALFGRRAY
jgi:uncharacterized membrane protein YeaQ/YmgE (transglycosylase-associated protein family)